MFATFEHGDSALPAAVTVTVQISSRHRALLPPKKVSDGYVQVYAHLDIDIYRFEVEDHPLGSDGSTGLHNPHGEVLTFGEVASVI